MLTFILIVIGCIAIAGFVLASQLLLRVANLEQRLANAQASVSPMVHIEDAIHTHSIHLDI